jgi:hypothetical protein
MQDLADHQPLGRARGLVADQLGERAVERLRELAQKLDRGVADAISTFARWRSETSALFARPLRVSPRRSRKARVRSPRAARKRVLRSASERSGVERSKDLPFGFAPSLSRASTAL